MKQKNVETVCRLKKIVNVITFVKRLYKVRKLIFFFIKYCKEQQEWYNTV